MHNKELPNVYALSSIIRMIRAKRMRWAVHVAQMREKRNEHRFLHVRARGKDTTSKIKT
jgi:hypothetical protein